MCYTFTMKKPKDGDHLDLSKKVETFEVPKKERWMPSSTKSFTHEYGKGAPTPSPTLAVAHHYPYLLEGTPEYERRVAEFLDKY